MAEIDPELVVLAKLAGLQKVLDEFPDDILYAGNDARVFLSMFASDLQPGDEPWPPMQVKFHDG